MPQMTMRLRPGVNVEATPALNEAGISVSNLIRFRNGLPEKLGGWTAYYPSAVGGVPKCLLAWQDLNANQYLGIGTTTLLGTVSSNVLTNLTPQTLTSDFAPKFSTTNGSATVTVDDLNIANVTTFDSIEFVTPVAVGGLILSGVYPIALVTGTTTYQITAASLATSTVSNGGSVPSFAVTSGSATVTVTLAAHGLAVDSTIAFGLATTVGGVTISGTYTVTSVPSANTFTITANTTASSTTSGSMNGGNTRLAYYIAIGPVATAAGYGLGTYGSGGYGTGVATSAQTGTPITATDWTLDNWGQTFLACPDGGGIYAWTPNTGYQNAQLVSGAPIHNTGAFVSTQTQMLICYGSTSQQDIGSSQDPLLVQWSAQGDYADFTVSTTSQAGSRRLPQGSKIVGGMSVPQQELLWTDLDLWSMNYLGSLAAGVWGFTKIGSNCGLIGKHAATRQGSQIYWMSPSNFWVTGSGQPTPIPCSVWDKVFQDLNTAYQTKCWCWSNTPFNEIWWFYPRASTNATEPDAFVKYNVRENVWDYGPLSRSAGIDQSLLGMPIAATPTGIVYKHESSQDADGQPINAYFETGLYELSEGEEIAFVDWVLPDMKFQTASGASSSANIQLTFTSYYYTGGTSETHGPYTFSSSTTYINPRIRGRFVSVRVESNDVGSWWRLGAIRMRVAKDGRL